MSALHRSAQDYLAIRRAGGFRLQHHDAMLADFADYLETLSLTRVTVEACLAWAARDDDATPNVIARRLSSVRRFATYMRSLDEATEVPPLNLVRSGAGRITPYLYSSTEVLALMRAAGRLGPPLKAATFETLIGLMATTGLRTTEATGLERDDVDLAGQVLVVRHSKFDKSRLVPIHASTAAALAAYAKRRDQLCPRPSVSRFLVSALGLRLQGAVSETFRRLADEAGITAPPGRRAPRLSDLRHSFAVSTLVGWYAEGGDVQARLPILSTYLGHLNPKETYWYYSDSRVIPIPAPLCARWPAACG